MRPQFPPYARPTCREPMSLRLFMSPRRRTARNSPASVTFAAGEEVKCYIMRAIADLASDIGEGLWLDFGELAAQVTRGTLGPCETVEILDKGTGQAKPSVAGLLLTLGYPEGGLTWQPIVVPAYPAVVAICTKWA